MLNLLRKRWWKYASVALLLFTLVGGLYFPLSSGITSVSPEKLEEGNTFDLQIETYNTHFTATSAPAVYLSGDSIVFCAKSIQVINERTLAATFDLPAGQLKRKSELLDVIVVDSTLGTFRLGDAFALTAFGNPLAAYEPCVNKIENLESATFNFPYRIMLYESIRNLFFHVPMWFTMVMLLLFSFGSSIAYLRTGKLVYDTFANHSALVGLLFGALGIVTGMLWAKFTWGAYWPPDPKLNGAAVGMLIYFAYFVLRGSLTQREQRARVAAVYGIFAYVIFIVFIFVLPRLNDSLHPGSGGNDQFAVYDLNNRLRIVFYAASLGFILLGYWLMSISIRTALIKDKADELTENDKTYDSLAS